MKKIRLVLLATLFTGTSVLMMSCGGNSAQETEPDESSIQSEDMYEEGDEPLESTGANDDDTADTTTIE